jgi:hypothetical protein
MTPYRESRMRATRFDAFIARLLPLLAFPAQAVAQTAGVDSPATAPASSPPGGGIVVVVVVVALLLAIGVGVKLYDLKRKRAEEVASLQSQISDALQLDRALAGLPIAAFASGSLWQRSPVVVAVTGPVPTPELRDAVMRVVERELSRRQPGARAEDRLVVDPLMGKHVA